MVLRNNAWVRWGLPLTLGLLLLTGWQLRRKNSAPRVTVTPLPQDSYIQVYFNHSQSQVYQDPYRGIRRYGDNLEQVLIQAIEQAQTSVDVAVHELNLPLVAQALCDRNAANVQVRVILENTYRRSWSEYRPSGIAQLDQHRQAKYDDFLTLADLDGDGSISASERQQRDALFQLEQCQIPIVDDTADGSKGSGLMHHKFMVIDGRTLVTGSANWTLSGVHGDLGVPESRGNANALLVIESTPLAALYQEEFAVMWGDGPEGRQDSLFGLQKPYRAPRPLNSIPGSRVTVQFSPTSKSRDWSESVNGLIAATLQQAQSRTDLSLFVFSDQPIGNVLSDVAGRGVEVRALIDPGFVYRSYSEALDMLGTALPDHRCQFETQNQPWRSPILSVGTPTLPPGDKLHHKFALVDSTTVILGSQNWSKAANTTNDENLLIVENPTVAAHFQREFERLYAEAELGMTPQLLKKQQALRQQCGS